MLLQEQLVKSFQQLHWISPGLVSNNSHIGLKKHHTAAWETAFEKATYNMSQEFFSQQTPNLLNTGSGNFKIQMHLTEQFLGLFFPLPLWKQAIGVWSFSSVHWWSLIISPISFRVPQICVPNPISLSYFYFLDHWHSTSTAKVFLLSEGLSMVLASVEIPTPGCSPHRLYILLGTPKPSVVLGGLEQNLGLPQRLAPAHAERRWPATGRHWSSQ